MAEYIEREAAKRLLVSDYAYAAADLLDKVPTADVVEVVRCKDCKHGEVDDPDNFPDLHYCHEGCGWNNADFYCKSGERRDKEYQPRFRIIEEGINRNGGHYTIMQMIEE